ncbi:hypothetical protein CYLTODRAFT_383677 [Cylindrobasidium torrendii FP15055 ss-10]|uniref:Chitin-binding type-4 domain-containing protein n=1 Tax=Cylindrobasidium torrendii FP15055 ss-10 TaxID=1314674 RepID=A0A0D7AX18_9AGAR|nr:hypothetical protein CYLTODRAFT_383677 [Cylindrobasidium torrendii FP15055 ss-10]
MLAIVAPFVLLAGQALAHGAINTPPSRSQSVGSAFQDTCGLQMFYQVSSDHYGNIQGEMQVADSSFDASSCNLWLCKGYQFSDNSANVQSYTAGQAVTFKVDIHAPHTGTANVSIVDTTTGSIIGEPLISWDSYASTSTGVAPGDTDFLITMPDLGSQCANPGDCVIQWFWDARSIDQTYEDCVDFTMGGSESASSAVPATSSTAPATSSSVSTAASSSAAAPATSSSAATTSSSSAIVPTTSAVTSASEPATSAAAPTTSAVPTTSAAPPTSTSVASPAPSGGVQDANACMNTYNKCIAQTQPNPDWTGCGATKDTCLSTAKYMRRALKSGTLGRRLRA